MYTLVYTLISSSAASTWLSPTETSHTEPLPLHGVVTDCRPPLHPSWRHRCPCPSCSVSEAFAIWRRSGEGERGEGERKRGEGRERERDCSALVLHANTIATFSETGFVCSEAGAA